MPRPVPTFLGFVGHAKEVAKLLRQLDGAKARGEPFPPTLFTGPSGSGKTLLAKCLADKYGTSLVVLIGDVSVAELEASFLKTKPGDCVFIDEVHNLPSKAQELLYHVIDNSRVPTWDGEGKTADSQRYAEIAPVTVMLATDQPGKLLNALHKRMELPVHLGFYNKREMKAVVDRLASDLNLLISAQAANQLARVSWGLPRKAKHLLLNLRRHFPWAERKQITLSHVREFLTVFNIDGHGLGKDERDYLRFLAGNEPAALETISLHLGHDSEYVKRQIEPILQRAQLLVIGKGGRRLTVRGRRHYGKKSGGQTTKKTK